MESYTAHGVDQTQLALRLRQARRTRGLTQRDVADYIGIGRSAIIAIEQGRRNVRADEITKMASIYACPVNELLGQEESMQDFPEFQTTEIQGRVEISTMAAIRDNFRRLCDDYLTIESLTGAPLTRHYPDIYSWGRNPKIAGADVALAERNRLGLGDGPLTELREVLEASMGLRIFSVPIQPLFIAGMYAYYEKAGGCILLNGNHPSDRQRWSLACEYGHFLSDRYRPHIALLGLYYEHKTDADRFADHFAMSFLMPAPVLRQRFRDTVQSRGGFAQADLFNLAHLYSVSIEAMCRRLEELGLIVAGTWDTLRHQVSRARRVEKWTGPYESPIVGTVLPLRYQFLTVQAFEQRRLTEEQLAGFLRWDRTEARKLAKSIFHSREIDEQGQVSDLIVDASKPIGVVDF